jgi:hypothetical protein
MKDTYVIGDVPTKGTVGPLPLPLLLLGHEVSSLCHHVHPAIASRYPYQRPKTSGFT